MLDLEIFKLWFGAIRGMDNMVWTWSDMSPWDFSKWGSGQESKEKQRARDRDHCGLLNLEESGWQDEPCESKKSFICSRKICKKSGVSCS